MNEGLITRIIKEYAFVNNIDFRITLIQEHLIQPKINIDISADTLKKRIKDLDINI